MSSRRTSSTAPGTSPELGKQQRQLHRADQRNQTGVVELIQFMRQYTEPLAPAAGPAERTKLFLYFGRRPRAYQKQDRIAEYARSVGPCATSANS